MKATLPGNPVFNGKNYSNDKELTSAHSVVTLRKGELREIITCRTWMARSRNASVVYATVWINGNNERTGGGYHFAGTGRAGGYGYHRGSAAISAAIHSAGIKLDKDISGVGDSAVREALQAIASAMGYRKTIVIEHG